MALDPPSRSIHLHLQKGFNPREGPPILLWRSQPFMNQTLPAPTPQKSGRGARGGASSTTSQSLRPNEVEENCPVTQSRAEGAAAGPAERAKGRPEALATWCGGTLGGVYHGGPGGSLSQHGRSPQDRRSKRGHKIGPCDPRIHSLVKRTLMCSLMRPWGGDPPNLWQGMKWMAWP